MLRVVKEQRKCYLPIPKQPSNKKGNYKRKNHAAIDAITKMADCIFHYFLSMLLLIYEHINKQRKTDATI